MTKEYEVLIQSSDGTIKRYYRRGRTKSAVKKKLLLSWATAPIKISDKIISIKKVDDPQMEMVLI